jgi:hypothetical protein
VADARQDVVVRELGSQDLQRDHEIVGVTDSPEDDAHAAFAERGLQPVRAEAIAGAELRHGARTDARARGHPRTVPHDTAWDAARA